MEVSQILQEELFGVVNRVTARVMAKFEEQISALQTMRDVATGMTIRGVLVVGSQLGKRRRHLSAEDEESEATDLGTGSQEDQEVRGKCGGTHKFVCHKFKCFKWGEREGGCAT